MTVVHSRTPDAKSICAEADILVAAIGRPEMVRGDWVKPGAAVIDVGTNPVPVSYLTSHHGKSPLQHPPGLAIVSHCYAWRQGIHENSSRLRSAKLSAIVSVVAGCQQEERVQAGGGRGLRRGQGASSFYHPCPRGRGPYDHHHAALQHGGRRTAHLWKGSSCAALTMGLEF